MSDTSTEVTTNPQVKPIIELKEPSMYKVIYINDSQTSMQFVVDSLIEYFGYGEMTAENVTEDIHVDGSAIVAVLPYEIAEQKGIEVTVDARSQGYPLQIKLEEDPIEN
jgi:ATP-dependent Clp protease adaptor protein ClpS